MSEAAVAEMPTKDQFAKQVDKSFDAAAPSGRKFEMSLTEFRDIADSETQETFSLLFRAPADTEPEQGTYTISNSELAEQAIFLVPVDRNEKGLFFEAVYNRFKE